MVNKTAFWLANFFFFRPLIGQYRVTPERSVKEGRKGWWMVHCQYSVTLPGETVPPIIIVTVNIWLGGNSWKRMLLTYWTGSSSQSLSDINSLWIDYLQQIGRNSLNIQNSRCYDMINLVKLKVKKLDDNLTSKCLFWWLVDGSCIQLNISTQV